jgi:hypothetical protein
LVGDGQAVGLAARRKEHIVNSIIWWVGAIVIVLFILGYLGFR